MLKRLVLLFLLAAAALALATSALAAGGHYTFEGGTAAERGQVVQALNASSFPWDIVPETIVVHIGHFDISDATSGSLWLDADLLDAGEFSWGIVQHEYAHEVDFLVLSADQRARLFALLGGTSWWNDGTLPHQDYGCERFATSVAWAFWPSAQNALRPAGPQDEGGELSPAEFRAALAEILPGAVPDRTVAAARKGTSGKPSARQTSAKKPSARARG